MAPDILEARGAQIAAHITSSFVPIGIKRNHARWLRGEHAIVVRVTRLLLCRSWIVWTPPLTQPPVLAHPRAHSPGPARHSQASLSPYLTGQASKLRCEAGTSYLTGLWLQNEPLHLIMTSLSRLGFALHVTRVSTRSQSSSAADL